MEKEHANYDLIGDSIAVATLGTYASIPSRSKSKAYPWLLLYLLAACSANAQGKKPS